MAVPPESIEIALKNAAETERIGARLGEIVAAGDVIALHGDLGAGKSTLARGLIRCLTGDDTLDVPSPTFTLVLTYDAPNLPIWHYDLYRLEDPEELIELGFDETQDGLALIEWPDRMGDSLPQWRLDITLNIAQTGRIAHLAAHGPSWSKRLDALTD